MINIREPRGTLAYDIKQLPITEITEILSEFDMKTEPREHQARTLLLGLAEDTFLYALDMGLGKTLIGIYLTAFEKQLEGGVRTLVTCPPLVTRQWNKEVAKHSDLSITVVGSNVTTKEAKLGQLERSTADITVVPHSWLISLFNWAEKDPKLSKHLTQLFNNFDILIIDEAHALRNPMTKGFRGYRKYFMDIKKRYLMTGTPIGNNYTGVWALYYLIDKGATFGNNYAAFLFEYFDVYDKGNYKKYVLKSFYKQQFMNLFWTKCIRFEESECNDLPGKTFTTLPVELTSEQTKAYDALLMPAQDIGDGTEELAVFALMKVTAGIGMKESPKLEAVKGMVQDICIESKSQFIVWCWLREESDYLLENLRKKFKTLRIEAVKGMGGNKDEILDKWALGQVDVLIANQKSLGIGVDLYEAHKCCFFSNNRSMIDRKQTEKRIHRTGQTKHCQYYDLVCEQTIDEVNLMIVQRAKDSFTSLTKDSDYWAMLKRQRVI